MPSSSFVWTVGSIALSSLITPTTADGSGSRYQLIEAWQGEKFLDHFNVFSGADPTNGFVTYTNQSYAESSGLIKVTESGSFYMGVDYQTELSPNGPGRDSVRIESKDYYDEGLYIIDLQHMPGSACGTWPAFWSVGPNWPYDGEIDIIEGVNKHEANKIVLHTSGSCALSSENDMSGSMTSSECGEASGTIGCVVEGQTGTSGDPFNEKNGGVYAMEWTSSFVKIWYFARSEIPQSITEGNPDTTAFGTPMAHLQGTCDFHERFKSQKFILDTTFCGDWAGGVFGDSGCPVSDPSNPIQSCVNYVAQNPAAFKEAYWEINYIKLFQTGAGHSTASVVPQAQTATAVASRTGDNVPSITSTPLPETTAPAPETASVEAPATSSAVPEPANPQTSVAGAETTAAPAPSTQTTAAPARPSSDDSEEGADAVSETTIYVTETTTFCGASTQKGSIQTLGGGETDVSPASSTVEPTATPAAPTSTAQEPVASQPGTVSGGTPVPTDVSPETPAEQTAGESSAPTPSAQQPEQSQSAATSIEASNAPPAASTSAPAEQGTPEGASPVGATESRQVPDEPSPTSVAPIHSPSHSSWVIPSSSRVASSSSFASTTTSASRTTSATHEATAPTETDSGASTGTNPESPVFTAGASKSVGISSMAGIVCGVVVAMLA
ncbi:putative endo-1,3(4)-beta-glucanase [Aspergillus pseudocaelatus]|uniref:endo-1,3(4)-beta-glucanase n=1 Tax=Aspergillus pseudocaelatus TaxID=1825620 RepID=A0ABQ6WR34_9EURO|nr:putative endo-1,3(4)-beta-glucanase [Aspergillus pseudocaelatus]